MRRGRWPSFSPLVMSTIRALRMSVKRELESHWWASMDSTRTFTARPGARAQTTVGLTLPYAYSRGLATTGLLAISMEVVDLPGAYVRLFMNLTLTIRLLYVCITSAWPTSR